jgi:hypothetical protein
MEEMGLFLYSLLTAFENESDGVVEGRSVSETLAVANQRKQGRRSVLEVLHHRRPIGGVL